MTASSRVTLRSATRKRSDTSKKVVALTLAPSASLESFV